MQLEDPHDDVKALPLLDPYVQGDRERARFLEGDRNNDVYDGGGNSTATLVHRGRIIGIWQPVRKQREIRFHLFDAPSTVRRQQVEEALASAAVIYFDRPADLNEITVMEPLKGPGGSRSASHPLNDVLHRANQPT